MSLATVTAGTIMLAISAEPAVAGSAPSPISEITVAHGKALSGTGALFGVAVDPAADVVAITGKANASQSSILPSAGRVWLINGHTHRITATIKLPGATEAGVAFDPAAGAFVVADNLLPTSLSASDSNDTGGVVEIDPHTGRIKAEFPISGGGQSIAVDALHRVMYLTGPGYSITVMNARTGKTIATVPNIYYPFAVSVDPGSRRVYVAGGVGTKGVWEVDGATNAPIGFNGSTKPVTVALPEAPQGIDTDPATGNTYVLYSGSTAKVEVLRRGSHGLKISLKNTNSAVDYGIALDALKHKVYVSSESEIAGCPNVIAEIDGRANKVLGYVYGVAQAAALAVDARTDTVWALNGSDVAAFKGGLVQKPPKCGTTGVTIGS